MRLWKFITTGYLKFNFQSLFAIYLDIAWCFYQIILVPISLYIIVLFRRWYAISVSAVSMKQQRLFHYSKLRIFFFSFMHLFYYIFGEGISFFLLTLIWIFLFFWQEIFACILILYWGFFASTVVNGGSLTSHASVSASPTLDVTKFGAIGDGKADDTKVTL